MTLRASTGSALVIREGLVGFFETLDYLNPRPAFSGRGKVLEATQSVTVDTSTQADGAPPVSYLWKHIAGQPVTIATPTARESKVSLGDGASGIGTSTVRLTMTLEDGTSESADLLIRTVHDTDLPWASFVRVPASAGPTIPERAYWGGPGVGQLRIVGGGDQLAVEYSDTVLPEDFSADWSVHLRNGDGAALRPGKYTDAWSASAAGIPSGANRLEFSLGRNALAPWGSDFTILELETDGAGKVTKLALDFVVQGVGDYSPTTGSVRWSSAVPLPP